MSRTYRMENRLRDRARDRASAELTSRPLWWLTPPTVAVGSLITHLPDHASVAGLGVTAGVYACHSAHTVVDRAVDDGFANGREIRRALSSRSARKAAAATRPQLAADGLRGVPVTEYAIRLAKRGRNGRRLYSTMEEVVILVAPPRTGKTAQLAGPVLDAPGSVVATSTRIDLYEHTAAMRQAAGGTVHVLNPEGLGGLASTFRWSPIDGCADPAVAITRAGYLLDGAPGGNGTEDKNFWEGANFRLLRCYLYAAAVAGRTMRDLVAWVGSSADRTPLDILEAHPTAPAGWARDVEQVMDSPAEKTRESVYLTCALALEFMADPNVAQAAMPEDGGSFDVEQFVLSGTGTLYLIGAERPHGSLAPYFSAFCGHLFETAKVLAGDQRGGRLDPPLLLVLDEAALICPVPLDRWTADAGGRGIPMLIAVQSPSQLRERWGDDGADTIWNNANIKVIFGGLGVHRHLEDISAICGERDEKTKSRSIDQQGHTSTSTSLRRVRVLPVERLRQLKQWEVLLLHRNTRPVLARITPVWQRADVRAYARDQARAQRRWDRARTRIGQPAVPIPAGAAAAVVTAVDPAVYSDFEAWDGRGRHPAGWQNTHGPATAGGQS